jgi:hypothetical protein
MDDNLIKDNCWKEIAGELHAQDKELSPRTQRCLGMAGARQGNGMVCVNRPLARVTNNVTVLVEAPELYGLCRRACKNMVTEISLCYATRKGEKSEVHLGTGQEGPEGCICIAVILS